MNAEPTTARPATLPTAARSLAPLGLVLPAVVVVVGVLLLGDGGYTPVHLSYPGAATALASAVLQLSAYLASAYAFGSWLTVAFISPRRGGSRLAIGRDQELQPAMWASLQWGVTATALIFVDSADASGQGLDTLGQQGAVSYLAQAAYLPRAWMVVAVLAFLSAGMALLAAKWEIVAFALPVVVVGLLAPVLVTQVLVGPNHDFGGDAAMFASPTLAGLIGLLMVAVSRPQVLRHELGARRMRLWCLAFGAITIAADLVISAFELAGGAPWATWTGRLFAVKFVLLVVIMVLLRPRPVRAIPACCAALLTAGVTVLMGRIPPPQYFEPTSIAQNFLGFDVTEPPGLLTYLTNWRPNLLFITLAVVAIAGYLLAVRRLHRRGDSWPVGRTISWVLGWLVVAVSTSSGMGRYAGVEFSVHMALHMTLNMLGPILMVLGGVVTLLLRASTPHAKGQPAGPHEWLTALMHSGFMRFMYHPFHVFAMFVGSYYVFYFTALFEETLRFHWAHQLAYLDFVMIGYLFYGLAIGVDQPPRPLPHLGKLAMILAAMPFHAFFGIVVMTRDTVIAETFYRYIDEPWMTDLLGDQYVGGGIAWAAGEFPLVIVIVALVLQWSREDSRIAKRKDRHLDSGLDTSHDAYNDMLAQLRGGRQREGSTHDRG